MNKGIINQPLLEQNIKQIEFYAKEEQKSLTKICSALEEGSKEYNSPNVKLLLDNISVLKGKIELINKKRFKYMEILNKVILKYNNLARETKNKFDGDN